jgi:hypothetical protein
LRTPPAPYRWIGATVFSGLTLAYALQHGWTARDLVWSFWLVTFTSGIAVPAGLTLVWALVLAAHPEFDRRQWRAFALFIAALVAVFALFLGLAHQFFLNFVTGFVTPLHENLRVEEMRRGVPVLALSENALQWWWNNLVAAFRAYWPFAAATLLSDALAFPWTRDGLLALNPLSLSSQLGARVSRLMAVQALLLFAYVLGLTGESVLFTLLFVVIHFLPAGFFAERIGGRREEGAQA